MIISDFDSCSDSEDNESVVNIPNKKYYPWVEKYRPKNIESIIEQNTIVNVLKSTISTGALSHLILYGPPGTGKTSTILAIAHQLFGPNKIEERVLELNASDDRGIGIVRNKIIFFSKLSLGTPDPNYPSPPFKFIILDEADAMTSEAQSALRKVMETKSAITRFCFICNYINKIIEPIRSRCISFRFKPVPIDSIILRLDNIAKMENLNLKKKRSNISEAILIAKRPSIFAAFFLSSKWKLTGITYSSSKLIYRSYHL